MANVKLKSLLEDALLESPDEITIGPPQSFKVKVVSWKEMDSVCFGAINGIMLYAKYADVGGEAIHKLMWMKLYKTHTRFKPASTKDFAEIKKFLAEKSLYMGNAGTARLAKTINEIPNFFTRNGVFACPGRLWTRQKVCSFWQPMSQAAKYKNLVFGLIQKLGGDPSKFSYEFEDSPSRNEVPTLSSYEEFSAGTRPMGALEVSRSTILDLAKKSQADPEAKSKLKFMLNTPRGYELGSQISTSKGMTFQDWQKIYT